MKKSIIFIAAVFAATVANAQITHEATILENCTTGIVNHETKEYAYFDYGKIPFRDQVNNRLVLYNTDGSLYKSIVLPSGAAYSVYYLSKNLFTADNKISFIISVQVNSTHKLQCYNEDGQVVFDFGEYDGSIGIEYEAFGVFLMNNMYKFIWKHKSDNPQYWYQTEIYSLPGDGKPQAINQPSSTKRNARKIAREGQVLVETENNTFDLRGQEVK